MNKDFTTSWRLDETYIKVKGKWTYLYRIVDSKGDSINFYLSEARDHKAALKCIHGAIKIADIKPDKINSDGNPANELAVKIINTELQSQRVPSFCGPAKPIKYTKVKYCNNILEQDHRRVKRVVDPMLGY